MIAIRQLQQLLIFLALGWLVIVPVLASDAWNYPHDLSSGVNTRYSSFAGAPKTLDPAKAYSSDELQFIAQIYEPLLQYHYFKRPYQLEPLTVTALPEVFYYTKDHQKLSHHDSGKAAYSVYDIYIKQGIQYEPHPAFYKDSAGQYSNLHLTKKAIDKASQLSDFSSTASRELTASDYAYQIKRLAAPWVNSPVFGVMKEHIVGFEEYSQQLQAIYKDAAVEQKRDHPYVDLRAYDFPGVKVLSRYHLQITLKNVYPQFKYWLAMPFFAPMPWEVIQFYSQQGLKSNNISLSWYPVGTGPYRLIENNPNRRMVLERNPLFRGEVFPTSDKAVDAKYKHHGEDLMPFVDRFEFLLDKESIPRWNKFLQGYYDKSGISADSFDQAITINRDGESILTPEMQQQDIKLSKTISPAVYYMGFNMLDPIVGGQSNKSRLLRQAISIAVDYEEYISIFMNGRGIAAQGPIPPGIYGYEAGRPGMNNVVYQWDSVEKKAKRKPIAAAKALMVQAGYPQGIDSTTGKALILNYDATASGADDKARMGWMRKQFAKIGIDLNIRSTQYNRFQEKVRTGNVQIFSWGWMADYPDPENFLFLLYGPNGKVKHSGENAANYNNAQVNHLFEEVKNMPDSISKQQKIDELLAILQNDSPWLWGVHPISYVLSHNWNGDSKPNAMANNLLKYERLNHSMRKLSQAEWNHPILWPIVILSLIVVVILVPLALVYWLRQNKPAVKFLNKDDEC